MKPSRITPFVNCVKTTYFRSRKLLEFSVTSGVTTLFQKPTIYFRIYRTKRNHRQTKQIIRNHNVSKTVRGPVTGRWKSGIAVITVQDNVSMTTNSSKFLVSAGVRTKIHRVRKKDQPLPFHELLATCMWPSPSPSKQWRSTNRAGEFWRNFWPIFTDYQTTPMLISDQGALNCHGRDVWSPIVAYQMYEMRRELALNIHH